MALGAYPSLSSTGGTGRTVLLQWAPPTVDITSKKSFTFSTCFLVQNRSYSCPVYGSLLGCRADRELTRFPSAWMVFEIRVSVRAVWASCSFGIW